MPCPRCRSNPSRASGDPNRAVTVRERSGKNPGAIPTASRSEVLPHSRPFRLTAPRSAFDGHIHRLQHDQEIANRETTPGRPSPPDRSLTVTARFRWFHFRPPAICDTLWVAGQAGRQGIALTSTTTKAAFLSSLALLVSLGVAIDQTARPGPRDTPATRNPNNIVTSMPAMPLAFEPNQGQADPAVRFLSQRGGRSTFLTGEGATFVVGARRALGRHYAPSRCKP